MSYPNYLSLDTETWPIHPGLLAPRLVCVQSCPVDEPYDTTVELRDAGLARVYDHLTNGGFIIGHNIAYDAGVLCAASPELLDAVFDAYDQLRIGDTMVRDQLRRLSQGMLKLDPETGKPIRKGQGHWSLAGLVHRHLGEDVVGKYGEDSWRTEYWKLDGVPVDQWPDAAVRYARLDATYPARLWAHLGPVDDEFMQTRHAFARQLMSLRGMKCNPERVAVYRDELVATIGDIDVQLRNAGLQRDDGSMDTKALRALILEVYPDAPHTETGLVSTSAETLAQCDHPLLEAYSKCVSAKSHLRGTYRELLAGTVTPMQAGHGMATTGRARSFDPNLQNKPAEGPVRPCVEARPGYVILTADFNQAELVAFAQVCIDLFGHSKMGDAINAGRDCHRLLASHLFNCDADSLAKDDPRRVVAKRCNFGLIGGMGALRFLETLFEAGFRQYDVNDAYRFIAGFRSFWPDADEYLTYNSELAGEYGGTFTVVQHRTGRVRGGCTYAEGANTRFQGLVGDITHVAEWECEKQMYRQPDAVLYDARLIGAVHDELVAELLVPRMHEQAMEVRRIMVEVAHQFCPDVMMGADIALQTNWNHDAKAVYDAAGRLQIWTP